MHAIGQYSYCMLLCAIDTRKYFRMWIGTVIFHENKHKYIFLPFFIPEPFKWSMQLP